MASRPRASPGSASARASRSALARSPSRRVGRSRVSPALKLLGQLRVALPAHFFVVGPGDDGHLVDADLVLELDDARHDLGSGAGEGIAPEPGDALLVVVLQFLGRLVR